MMMKEMTRSNATNKELVAFILYLHDIYKMESNVWYKNSYPLEGRKIIQSY